jgi:calcium-dependent protein kinase
LGTPYYIAPEVIKGKYNEKCDIWSCGVIMYIMLTGTPPFNGRNDNEILMKVQEGIVDYELEQLKYISESATSLIKLMLTYDPKKRISAQQALEHPWFTKADFQLDPDKQQINQTIKRLNEFNIDTKLKQATLHYIAHQLISKEETEELRKVFMKLDINNDGKLSYSEIVEGYKNYFGSLQPEIEGKMIFEKVDTDKSGFISYDEFICAALDFKNITNEEKLNEAFKMFDRNGDGFISAIELKEILERGNITDNEVINSIINEVDMNGDGEISLDEFKKIMLMPAN